MSDEIKPTVVEPLSRSLIDKYFVATSTKKGWWSDANIIKHMNHRYEGWKLHVEYMGMPQNRKDEDTPKSAESTSPVISSEIPVMMAKGETYLFAINDNVTQKHFAIRIDENNQPVMEGDLPMDRALEIVSGIGYAKTEPVSGGDWLDKKAAMADAQKVCDLTNELALLRKQLQEAIQPCLSSVNDKSACLSDLPKNDKQTQQPVESIGLLPCAFCGGEAMLTDHGKGTGGWFITCRNGGLSDGRNPSICSVIITGGSVPFHGLTKEQHHEAHRVNAIKIWNGRTPKRESNGDDVRAGYDMGFQAGVASVKEGE